MMDNEWNAPTPPVQVLDPLSQLNAYLQKINRNDGSSPDASDVDHDEILNVVEFLFGSKTLFASLALLDDPSGGITKVSTCSAPVKRSLYLIKGSKGTQSYLCYSANENAIDYCSCRSFFDKATKAGSGVLCKHLLALKLMPYLNIRCQEITTSSRKEFSKLVIDRTLMGSNATFNANSPIHHVQNT